MKFAIFNQWDQLPESANALFLQGERESLFYSRVWWETLTLHTLTENQSVLLACVLDEDSVAAILPMVSCPRDGLSALSNRYTSLFTILIIDHGSADAILDCMAEGLAQMEANAIQLDPIDANNGTITKLSQSLQSYGFKSHTYFRFYNWSHPVNGQSFQEYMAGRPANISNTINRKRRKLERENGYEIQLYQDGEIDRAMADYQKVYQSSWKANELITEFTPNLVMQLSEIGWLRLAILYVEGNPIAAQIWFVVHAKASIYRLVYDERWKKYSPGTILTEYLMHHVIDHDKVTEIDFLTGNEQYKRDWMTVQKERIGIRLAKKPMKKNMPVLIGQLISKYFSKHRNDASN